MENLVTFAVALVGIALLIMLVVQSNGIQAQLDRIHDRMADLYFDRHLPIPPEPTVDVADFDLDPDAVPVGRETAADVDDQSPTQQLAPDADDQLGDVLAKHDDAVEVINELYPVETTPVEPITPPSSITSLMTGEAAWVSAGRFYLDRLDRLRLLRHTTLAARKPIFAESVKVRMEESPGDLVTLLEWPAGVRVTKTYEVDLDGSGYEILNGVVYDRAAAPPPKTPPMCKQLREIREGGSGLLPSGAFLRVGSGVWVRTGVVPWSSIDKPIVVRNVTRNLYEAVWPQGLDLPPASSTLIAGVTPVTLVSE